MEDSDCEQTTPGSNLSNAQLHSFLLTNFDSKFQTPNQLLHPLVKYIPRNNISEIVPTRNGIIIKCSDSNLASTIRNKYSLEIFGSTAKIIRMETRTVRQAPPPRCPIL